MKKINIYKKAYEKENYILKKNCSVIASLCITLAVSCITSCCTEESKVNSKLENETSVASTTTSHDNESQTTVDTTLTTTLETKPKDSVVVSKPTETTVSRTPITTVATTTIPTTPSTTVTTSTKPITTTEKIVTTTTTTKKIVTTTTVPTTATTTTVPITTTVQTKVTPPITTLEQVYSTLPDDYYLADDMVNPLVESYYDFFYDEKNAKIELTQENINKPWYFPAYIERISNDRSRYEGYIKYTVNYGSEEYSSLNLFSEKILMYNVLYLDYLNSSTLKNMYGNYGIFTIYNEKITLEDIKKKLYMIDEYSEIFKEDIQMAKANYDVEGFLTNFDEKVDSFIEQVKKDPDAIANEFYEKFNSKVYTR